jgi:uncharacterized membrane protein YeiH
MLQSIEFLAVLASTIYGVLLARRNEMDFVGVFSVAFMVAFGGGTLRDLFLDRHPLFWIENSHYPLVVFAGSILTSFLRRVPKPIARLLPLVDAVGLGLFSIAGAGFAIEAGTSLFVASLLGVITGTFGGVMAEVVCNEVPSLFRTAPLYATCSFVGCWVFLGLERAALGEGIAGPVAAGTIVAFRLAALQWNLRFPNLSPPES